MATVIPAFIDKISTFELGRKAENIEWGIRGFSHFVSLFGSELS